MWNWIKERFLQRHKLPVSRPEVFEVAERARELATLGNKMFTTEDYRGAMEAYESALRVDGHCAEAWHRRGRVFMHDAEITKALTCFVRSLELDSQNADVWCGLGEAILTFYNADQEPVFIRENRTEIISEAYESFERALKLGGNLPKARQGREECRKMIKQESFRMAKSPLFSFHSGGILEKAKREVIAPFLKPSDYHRKAPLPVQND